MKLRPDSPRDPCWGNAYPRRRDENVALSDSLLPTSEPWLGVNFWSRSAGLHMWDAYDGELVRSELRDLAELGCNTTRCFLMWPAFMPRPDACDESRMLDFADFLEAHREVGMWTIPTLLVGHMSGMDFDPPWRGGRDLYRDVWMVSRQAWFAGELAKRFGAHPAIVGWTLSNEMPRYAGSAPVEVITAWAELVSQGLRGNGARQPISLGDGAWGLETSGRQNGYSLPALRNCTDFVGVHLYPSDTDPVRQMLAAAFRCELAGGAGQRVILEEFGVSSDFASDAEIAHYYRQALHATLLAGATGWLAWCNADYDASSGCSPYRERPYELHFGLYDAVGRPKPQSGELQTFNHWVRSLTRLGWRRIPPQAAIVVPHHLQHEVPFEDDLGREDLHANLFQSYVACREADIPVRLLPEAQLPAQGPPLKLYLVPCGRMLTATGWERLWDLAARGGLVYVSYFPGSGGGHHGSWLPGLEERFAVRSLAPVGSGRPLGDGEEIVWSFAAPLGPLPVGEVLRFRAAGTPAARGGLRLAPAGCRVLAAEAPGGDPALVARPFGSGVVVLSTRPVEHFAARTVRANPEDTHRLYDALAEEAGVWRPVRAHDPRVLGAAIDVGDKDLAMVVANASADEVTTAIVCDPRVTGGPPGGSGEVTLGPYEVRTALPGRA